MMPDVDEKTAQVKEQAKAAWERFLDWLADPYEPGGCNCGG